MKANGLERYQSLDALRGVAAFGVMIYHVSTRVGGPVIFFRGYLAVDMFFVLSGFVMAHSYGARLRSTLSFGGFLRRRLIRLMPLSALGAALGAIYLIGRAGFYARAFSPNVIASGVLNVLMLPTPPIVGYPSAELFPSNGVLWSLFFELIVNFLWAGALVRLPTKPLASLTVAIGCVAAALVLASPSGNPGWDWSGFTGGLARALFGFLAGVSIYRLRGYLVPRRPIGLWVPVALLIIALFGPLHSAFWDVLCMLAIMPAIIILGASRCGTEGAFEGALGDLSYPLYAIHLPLLMVFSGLRKALTPENEVGPWAYASLIPIGMIAWCALKIYDEPLRRWLGATFTERSRSAMPSPKAQ